MFKDILPWLKLEEQRKKVETKTRHLVNVGLKESRDLRSAGNKQGVVRGENMTMLVGKDSSKGKGKGLKTIASQK